MQEPDLEAGGSVRWAVSGQETVHVDFEGARDRGPGPGDKVLHGVLSPIGVSVCTLDEGQDISVCCGLVWGSYKFSAGPRAGHILR